MLLFYRIVVIIFVLSYCIHLLSFFLSFSLQIVWENRYVNDIGNDCLVSVDGTDFPLAWGSNHKRLSCYKFKGKPGLRYEVAVCLRTSDIVWTSGPHFPGLYNDLQIFREALIHMVDDGERVEADKGYVGDHPWYVKIPDGVNEKKDRTLLDSRQRSRHETVNNRFKRFGCMRTKFRHSVEKHGDCFNCVAILTQLSIDQGLGLFPTAYNDTLTDETAMIRNLPGVYNYYHILQEH